MQTVTLSNAIGSCLCKYSITDFRIEDIRGKVYLFVCEIGDIRITGYVQDNHTKYTPYHCDMNFNHIPLTDKEKKTVEDFVWDLRCNMERLINRYNYTYEIEWR